VTALRTLAAACAGLAVAWVAGQAPRSLTAQGDDEIPVFEFDPTWPRRPLPHNWTLGVIGGIHVDAHDAIWITHRGNTSGLLAADPLATAPGCCTSAPAIVVFDQAGAVIKAWGGPDPTTPGRTADGFDWPSEHGIFVDLAGNVWTGCEGGATDTVTGPRNCGSITKMSPDGRILWQRGRTGQTKGNADTQHFNSPTGITVDEAAREAFIADGYRNQRIAVIDADTGAFKRMWGPFNTPPRDIPRNQLNGGTSGRHEAAGLGTFGDSVHCIEMSRDGLLYVCDRGNNRIHVYRKDGTFVKEGFVAPETGRMGSAFDIAFSPDPAQRYLYLADGANQRVHILRRDSLAVLGSFGKPGKGTGELGVVHVMASDSRGHLYVGETSGSNRVMRFTQTGMQRRIP